MCVCNQLYLFCYIRPEIAMALLLKWRYVLQIFPILSPSTSSAAIRGVPYCHSGAASNPPSPLGSSAIWSVGLAGEGRAWKEFGYGNILHR